MPTHTDADLQRLAARVLARVLACTPRLRVDEVLRCNAVKRVALGLVSGCVWNHTCTICRSSKPFVHFARSEIDLREFLISGMCTDCQDEVFQPHSGSDQEEES